MTKNRDSLATASILGQAPRPKSSWKMLGQRSVYRNQWIELEQQQVISPAGKPHLYGKIFLKKQSVGVISLDDDNTWLVKHHHYPLGYDA